VFGDSGNIPRAVQHADDDHCVRERPVIDGVGAVKRHTQAGGKLFARGHGQRKIPHRLEGGFERGDKAGGDILRRLARDVRPDFGKVGFGGFREAKS
jgi:hypothetical protein